MVLWMSVVVSVGFLVVVMFFYLCGFLDVVVLFVMSVGMVGVFWVVLWFVVSSVWFVFRFVYYFYGVV